MKFATIALASAFALSSTFALAATSHPKYKVGRSGTHHQGTVGMGRSMNRDQPRYGRYGGAAQNSGGRLVWRRRPRYLQSPTSKAPRFRGTFFMRSSTEVKVARPPYGPASPTIAQMPQTAATPGWEPIASLQCDANLVAIGHS